MAAATVDRYTPPPLSLPEGHCQQTEPGSPWWWVRGASGWHLVNAETGECTCRHYVFRCAFRLGETCKHGGYLARHIEQQNECPTCHGRAFLKPALPYVGRDGKPDTEPLACVACSGTGKRSP